jgi:hypothetical protein
MVGERGFEPLTTSAQGSCSTRLSYSPLVGRLAGSGARCSRLPSPRKSRPRSLAGRWRVRPQPLAGLDPTGVASPTIRETPSPGPGARGDAGDGAAGGECPWPGLPPRLRTTSRAPWRRPPPPRHGPLERLVRREVRGERGHDVVEPLDLVAPSPILGHPRLLGHGALTARHSTGFGCRASGGLRRLALSSQAVARPRRETPPIPRRDRRG